MTRKKNDKKKKCINNKLKYLDIMDMNNYDKEKKKCFFFPTILLLLLLFFSPKLMSGLKESNPKSIRNYYCYY